MRKILHVDMDAFYASIEERDHPELKGKPMAVGGTSPRGVLTTANYEARKYGCRSAMPGFKALQLCPHLIMMPTRFPVYKADSEKIRGVFARFTEKIEPLSLDEAYLDISHLRSSAAAVAREIRHQITEETGLTASAGIASNKMLAKIASDWRKPNGQFEILDKDIGEFMRALPVSKLWGVGKKMQARLAQKGVETCGDLQERSKYELADQFGQWGLALYSLCRGEDKRAVRPHRVRKSLSKERTFRENISSLPELRKALDPIVESVEQALADKAGSRHIRSLVVKMKFADFERTTAERAHRQVERGIIDELLEEAWRRSAGKAVRLLGVGVRFHNPGAEEQMELFGEAFDD